MESSINLMVRVGQTHTHHFIYILLCYFLLSERITVKVSKVSINSFSSAAS